ncbi:MAG: DUF2218 domain-containing protein [Sneathiellaceae bacterium]
MICSEARIRTSHAGAYLSALSRSLGGDGGERADSPAEAKHEAHFDLEGGHCDLRADTERLVIACTAPEPAAIGALRALVERNFPPEAEGDEIEIVWHTIDL